MNGTLMTLIVSVMSQVTGRAHVADGDGMKHQLIHALKVLRGKYFSALLDCGDEVRDAVLLFGNMCDTNIAQMQLCELGQPSREVFLTIDAWSAAKLLVPCGHVENDVCAGDLDHEEIGLGPRAFLVHRAREHMQALLQELGHQLPEIATVRMLANGLKHNRECAMGVSG